MDREKENKERDLRGHKKGTNTKEREKESWWTKIVKEMEAPSTKEEQKNNNKN